MDAPPTNQTSPSESSECLRPSQDFARARLFAELVRHFFGRFFDKESLSPQGQPEAVVARTLGLLIPPGGFVCLLLLLAHPEDWDLVVVRFLFICYSMIAMGVVMVFEWDALFPDRRDYLILTPLPLQVWMFFLAKIAALGIFLAIFLAAVNFLGVLFWPGVERHGNFLSVMGTHLAVTVAAGLFSALAIAALQGVLVTVFRGTAYRRISVFVQTALMAVLILLLVLSPQMSSNLQSLCQTDSPYLRWFPGFWFVGLYEQLRPAVSQSGELSASPASAANVLMGLGTIAVRSVWFALAIFAVSFLSGYRRHARKVMESPEPNAKGPGLVWHSFDAAIHRLLGDPVECGVFYFISQTLVRSLKHRLFLATYGGFGTALVVIMLEGGGNARQIPLMLSFVLISGLRAAFNFPSDLRANWSFQLSETTSVAAYVRATRKWVMLYAILPLFLLFAAIEALHLRWTVVAFHFAFGMVVSIVLMDVLFLGFRKVPFTCSHFPGKVNLTLLAVMYVFGFTFYSRYMASLEEWLWEIPVLVGAFFLVTAGSMIALGCVRERGLSTEAGLEYEDDGNPAVRTLGLAGQ